ncbi:MAG: glycerophosphodiester phosphodiesterase [Pseudomonadota bacterium]
MVRLPKVIGHRGAAASAPENTIASIRRAAALGARWVEFDAKLTKDNVVILMHDDTLDRTTTGHGPVKATRWSEIRRLDAGAWFGPDWRGTRVPKLADVLAELVRLGLGANIEIKPCPGREVETAAAVVEIVRKHWPRGRDWPLLSSFALESLVAARDLAPELPRGLLIWDGPEQWRAEAGRLGCRSVHFSNRHLPADLGAIRRAGLGVAIYTVNDRLEARRLLDAGADCIITDRPDAIIAA